MGEGCVGWEQILVCVCAWMCVCGYWVNLVAPEQGRIVLLWGLVSAGGNPAVIDSDCVYMDSNNLTFELILNQTISIKLFDWTVGKDVVLILLFPCCRAMFDECYSISLPSGFYLRAWN